MRVFITLPLIFIFSLIAGAQAQTSPAQAQTDEETKLNAEIVRLYNEGKFDEALPLAKRLLAIEEKSADRESPLMATALNNVGAIYASKGKYSDAKPYYQRSLKITETKIGPDSLNVATILDRLAVINYAEGDYGKTEELSKRSLAIREQKLGATHSAVLESLSRLAEFYQLRAEYKKAEPLLQRIVTVKESASGPARESLSESLYQYACLKRKMRETDEAAKLETRAQGELATAPDLSGVLPADVGVVNGRAIDLPKPPYPQEAKPYRESGTVNVRVLINEKGRVIRACAINGPSVFWRVTEQAAYRSVFSPTLMGGQAVKVTGMVTYKFVAQ